MYIVRTVVPIGRVWNSVDKIVLLIVNNKMPETRSGLTSSEVVIAFIKSEEFSLIIRQSVASITREYDNRISALQNEIKILRESNIDMVNMMTNFPGGSRDIIVNGNVDRFNRSKNTSICKTVRNEKVDSKKSEKSSDKQIRVHKKPEEFPKLKIHQTEIAKERDGAISAEVNEEDDDNFDEWKSQRSQRRHFKRNSNIIVGKLNEKAKFKGVTRFIDYHVFNCERDLTVDKLKNYLIQDVKISEVSCEKMASKHPERYSSFKVSVPENCVNIFKNPDIWPEYVCINRFNNRFLRVRISKEAERI